MTFKTIKETAEYLQLHEMTVYKLIKSKKIPAFKVGKGWRVPQDELDKFFEVKA